MNRTPWFAFFAALLIAGCSKDSSSSTTTTSDSSGKPTPGAANKGPLKELKVDKLSPGTGPGAEKGDSLTMTYTGTLADGTVFDSNDKPDGKPFTFKLGYGTVIKGWDQGLVGIKKGAHYKLSIPAVLGYGSKDMGKIPPNSDLYFDVKLVDILRQEDEGTVVVSDVKQGTGAALKAGDTAVVNYSGTLSDGTQLDSQMDVKKPISFKVGANPPLVIPGIDSGVVGMKKGGERTIQIPPEFGPRNPGIPPGSVTKYDVILRDIKH